MSADLFGHVEAEAAPAPKWTERRVLDLLHDRYTPRAGNGGVRYVKAEHVRSCCGFDAKRTADFVAMDLWESSGLPIHGHEVKISRGDWLRELRDPSKSAEFMAVCDYWWLVCPADVATVDELPPGWGLMIASDRGVRIKKQAPRLTERASPGRYQFSSLHGPVRRTFTGALMRSAVKTAERRAKP